MLSNLLRRSIWCFLIEWWTWIAWLIEFPESKNICSVHGFGKKWISRVHLNFNLFARPYSSWSCFHGFTAPSALNSFPTKLKFGSEEEEEEEEEEEKKTYYHIFWKQHKAFYSILKKQIIWFAKKPFDILQYNGNKCFKWINPWYFLIPTSNENNVIYLLITQTSKGEIKRSFYSSWVALDFVF